MLRRVTATPEQRRQAADPTTSGATLAALAADLPELHPVIAGNPATYPGLLTWLRDYGGAEVQAALDARERAASAPPAPPAPQPPRPPAPPVATAAPVAPAAPVAAPRRFVEPSRSVPIAWLNHDLRYALALVGFGLAGLFAMLIVPILIEAVHGAIYNSSYDNSFDYEAANAQFNVASFLLGSIPWILIVAAVIVLPARPQATFVAAMIAGAPILLHLLALGASLVQWWGVSIVVSYVGLLAPAAAIGAWLVARMRPRAAFALLPIPVVLSFLFDYVLGGFYGYDYYGYGGGSISGITVIVAILRIGVLVGVAWLARSIAANRANAPTAEERAEAFEAQQHAARVEYVRQWEAAYAGAHGGEKPPPGTIPPMNSAASNPYGSPMGVPQTGATNTMAILALVFGIGGGWLGILFGHMALSQIRRTGEQGRGLALAGLICGYIGASITIIVIIVLIVVSVTTRSYYY
jgi:hypothetical protein